MCIILNRGVAFRINEEALHWELNPNLIAEATPLTFLLIPEIISWFPAYSL